jgi:hypothetical protein
VIARTVKSVSAAAWKMKCTSSRATTFSSDVCRLSFVEKEAASTPQRGEGNVEPSPRRQSTRWPLAAKRSASRVPSSPVERFVSRRTPSSGA